MYHFAAIILQCVCSLCSLNKAYLPYDKEESKRACNICNCYDECKNKDITFINSCQMHAKINFYPLNN